ncbi:MAG: phosphoribosylglycinamide formyltransferase [Pseudomonadota bacterium]
MAAAKPLLPVVVLISGRGSNLQAIIEAAARGECPVEIRAVISNRPDAEGLQNTALRGIRTLVIDHACYSSRESFDLALMTTIDTFEPALVVLAGFMRILTPGFVRHYHGRMLNIHPSLLPDFPGLNTHARVLEAGCKEHGTTVHFVTEETDGGPAVAQVRMPVQDNDNVTSLAARVLAEEHRLFPLAIRWFAEGRLSLDNSHVLYDGRALPAPRQLEPATLR